MGGAEQFDILLKVVELVAVIGGGGVFIFKMGRAVSKFEEVGKQQASDIRELKDDMKTLVSVTTKQALQDQELSQLRTRINLLDKKVDELRHGEGFVYPLGTYLSPKKD